jgi:hypothetical protein
MSKMGFDLNSQRDSDQCTPLHLGIWKKQQQAIKTLNEIGVDWTLKNSYGESCDDKCDEKESRARNRLAYDDKESRATTR